MTLGFLGDDFAILPNVDRRAVHARGLSHDLLAILTLILCFWSKAL